jgi:hypothetical protein
MWRVIEDGRVHSLCSDLDHMRLIEDIVAIEHKKCIVARNPYRKTVHTRSLRSLVDDNYGNLNYCVHQSIAPAEGIQPF